MYTRLLLLLGVALPCALAIYCPPNACQEMDINCPAISNGCRGQTTTTGGGFCGCCSLCIVALGEGDICFDPSNILLGAPVYERRECKQGLTCNPTSRQCERTVAKKQAVQTCAVRLAQISAQIQDHITEHGIPPLGSDLPRCEADGTYSPVQCQGSRCYCAMPDGSSIEGYSVHRWENQGMNCACALAKETVRQSGLIGVMHRCSANGNYEPVQCRGSVCYCVDEAGARVGQSTAPIGSSDSLNC